MIDERMVVDWKDDEDEEQKVSKGARLIGNIKYYAIKAAPLVLPVIGVFGLIALGDRWIKNNDIYEKVEKQEGDITNGPFYSGEVDQIIGDTGWFVIRNVEVCPDQISEDLANGRYEIRGLQQL